LTLSKFGPSSAFDTLPTEEAPLYLDKGRSKFGPSSAALPVAPLNSSLAALPGPGLAPHAEPETDSHRVAQRQKQVDFGYDTLAYDNYTLAVPKGERKADKVEHPRTPDVQNKCSKRAFDGLIRVWKQQLHSHWAPACDGEGDGDDNSMSSDEAPGAKAAQASTHSAAKEVDEEGAGEFWSQLKGEVFNTAPTPAQAPVSGERCRRGAYRNCTATVDQGLLQMYPARHHPPQNPFVPLAVLQRSKGSMLLAQQQPQQSPPQQPPPPPQPPQQPASREGNTVTFNRRDPSVMLGMGLTCVNAAQERRVAWQYRDLGTILRVDSFLPGSPFSSVLKIGDFITGINGARAASQNASALFKCSTCIRLEVFDQDRGYDLAPRLFD
jgi:hypothetical protein